jgi:transcription-repair coupling factor (superfamily II helicase)
MRRKIAERMVESLRRYDPSSQRSTGPTDQVVIVPVRERFDDDAGEDARTVAVRSGADEGISLFHFLGSTQAVRVIVSEYEQVRDTAAAVRSQLETSFADAAGRGVVTARPPDRTFVALDDIGPRLESAPRFEELMVDDAAGSEAIRHIRCMPAIEFHGRVPDWIVEIRQARERGDTVLFVADSPGRAERALEILKEYEIVAVSAELAEDAHAATVLVSVGTLSRGFRLAEGERVVAAFGAAALVS